MLTLADHEISRFPSKERAHMPVSKCLSEEFLNHMNHM
jgi:hypothetical protein